MNNAARLFKPEDCEKIYRDRQAGMSLDNLALKYGGSRTSIRSAVEYQQGIIEAEGEIATGSIQYIKPLSPELDNMPSPVDGEIAGNSGEGNGSVEGGQERTSSLKPPGKVRIDMLEYLDRRRGKVMRVIDLGLEALLDPAKFEHSSPAQITTAIGTLIDKWMSLSSGVGERDGATDELSASLMQMADKLESDPIE